MENAGLPEATCFDKLLGLKVTPDLKWNSYIESIAKEAAKMVSSPSSVKEIPDPTSILYKEFRYALLWNIDATYGQVLQKHHCLLLMQSRNSFAH